MNHGHCKIVGGGRSIVQAWENAICINQTLELIP